MTAYRVIFSASTRRIAEEYAAQLARGDAVPGARLARRLARSGDELSGDDVLQGLLDTKLPQIFAESAVAGDGSDWNARELEILGDVGIAAEVTVYDDGRHTQPTVHAEPFGATLVFTCGALLRNGQGREPADLARVRGADGGLDLERYHALFERRLLPVLEYVNATAAQRGRAALITVPGLGCGQFAGRWAGSLGERLHRTLARLLEQHAPRFGAIRVVIFDPYDECADEEIGLGHLHYRVRPLRRSAHPRPQLCLPAAYQQSGDDFGDCDLYSLVAWDPVSWPGNDFYVGSRATDDGVKAAATSVMRAMTGIAGRYDPALFQYRPPPGYRNWEQVVRQHALGLHLGSPFVR